MVSVCFFSGCNFQCVYCQNWDISQRQQGIYIEADMLALSIKQICNSAKNVNWVGGEPTPNLLYIIEVLQHCHVNLPMIWNSNMYCSMETMGILQHIIDLYLTDFKYGSDTCAERLSKVPSYWETVTRNHLYGANHGDMIIRHLVLPNHVECCSKPIIDWIAANVSEAHVNIMDQYHPAFQVSAYPDLMRHVTSREHEEVTSYAETQNLILI